MAKSAVESCARELKELEEILIQCCRCGTCQSVCPLYKKDSNESAVARGKIYMIEALMEGKLEKVEEIFKYVDYCILCGRCKNNCPSGVKTDEIFLKAKSILRKVKKMPAWQKVALKVAMGHPKLLATMSPMFHMGLRIGTKKIEDGVFKPYDVFGGIIGDMTKRHVVDMPAKALTSMYGGFNQAKNEKHRVIFYPGCASTLIYVHWGVAIIETLMHHGVSVYVPETNKCCGIPSATMGELGIYRDQVNDNFDYFDSITDADTILMCCPTCEYGLGALGEKETGRTRGKQVMDVVLYMAEVLKVKVDKKVKLPGTTTLHVPCHYKNGKEGVLKQFIKDTFETEYHDLANQSCCGFGGTFSLKNYPHTKEIGKKKATEIRDRGFNNLFTACPGCAMNLTDANMTEGNKLQTSHPIVEYYAQVVKPQKEGKVA